MSLQPDTVLQIGCALTTVKRVFDGTEQPCLALPGMLSYLRFTQVVERLPYLEKLGLAQGCARLHCLRLISQSLRELDLHNLKHVLTW